jgi:hypothetical protein
VIVAFEECLSLSFTAGHQVVVYPTCILTSVRDLERLLLGGAAAATVG